MTVPRNRGFTLIEVTIAMAVVALLYALLAFTTVQIARFTRDGGERALHKARLMELSERIRWQLRCLQPIAGQESLRSSAGDQAGRARLRFYTSQGKAHKGVVEVGYRVEEIYDKEGGKSLTLVYREFPFADPEGLRSLTDQQDAPWEPLEPKIVSFELAFSHEGVLWQRDWDESEAPIFVRIKLQDELGEIVSFDVSPGVRSKRW